MHELNVTGAGVGQFSDLRGEGGLLKKEGMLSLPHLERQRACHDITNQLNPKQMLIFQIMTA